MEGYLAIIVFVILLGCNKSDMIDPQPEGYELDITILGAGDLTISPENETYESGTTVEITALPMDKWSFLEWRGDFSGNEISTDIIMDGSKKVSAVFQPNYDQVLDLEENIYNIFDIGDQTWMTDNLNTTLFRDGDTIMQAQTVEEWKMAYENETPAWVYYNNSTDYGEAYGKIYNEFAILSNKLCPTGWHVPTDEEWKTLEIYLGMSVSQVDSDGYRSKDVADQLSSYRISPTPHPRWSYSFYIPSNSSGFSAIPGGARVGIPNYPSQTEGEFLYLGEEAIYWSSNLIARGIKNDGVFRGLPNISREFGFYCRCIKD